MTGVVAALFAPIAHAQQYPAKPVKVITPFPPGAGPDAMLRVLADKLSRAMGQPFVIENRPGGNGFIAAEAGKRSPADGYTLVHLDNFHLGVLPHLYKHLPYDPVLDFEPITPLFETYFFIVVSATSKWNSVGDLLVAARARPGALRYGSWGIGSPGHLGAAQLESLTGTQMTHVPYKDFLQLYSGVGNAELEWAFGSAGSAGPSYRAGKVRFLAYAGAKRLEGYRNIPTVTESGGPEGFEVGGWTGLLAPHGTPKQITSRMAAEVRAAMSAPDVHERLVTFGYEAYTTTPEEMAKVMANDSQKFAEVIKRADIVLY